MDLPPLPPDPLFAFPGPRLGSVTLPFRCGHRGARRVQAAAPAAPRSSLRLRIVALCVLCFALGAAVNGCTVASSFPRPPVETP